MNAFLFSQRERSNEAAQEMQRSRRIDADEAYTEAVDEIENEFATNHAVVLDIISDVIFETDWADAVAALYVAGRPDHAGRVLTDRIANHIKARAIREQAARDAKAAEDAVAERWLEREGR